MNENEISELYWDVWNYIWEYVDLYVLLKELNCYELFVVFFRVLFVIWGVCLNFKGKEEI